MRNEASTKRSPSCAAADEQRRVATGRKVADDCGSRIVIECEGKQDGLCQKSRAKVNDTQKVSGPAGLGISSCTLRLPK